MTDSSSIIDELHALILDHLKHIGTNEELLSRLSTQLCQQCCSAEGSDLLRIFQFAAQGTVGVELLGHAGPLGSVSLKSKETVRELKEASETLAQIPVKEQNLLYNGRFLNDEEVLAFVISPLRPRVEVCQKGHHHFYVFGGLHDNVASLTAESFDPSTHRWTRLPDMKKPHATSSELDGCVVSVGSRYEPDQSAASFDPSTMLWQPLPSMPHALELFQSVSHAGQLYVIGGRGPVGISSRTVRFNPKTRTWETLPPLLTARHSFVAAVLEGCICVAGGQAEHGRNLASTELFDPDGGGFWTQHSFLASPRHSMTAACVNSMLYVIGGVHSTEAPLPLEEGPSAMAEVLAPLAAAWDRLPNMNGPRCGCAATSLGKSLCVLGGAGQLGEALGVVEVFDYDERHWSSLPDMITPRKDLAAFRLEQRIYVFGGGDISSATASGEFLDATPERVGQWTSLPSMTQPRGGLSACAVMI